MELAAERNLTLLNSPYVFTCVRPQGSSIVDLTWSSARLLDRVTDWRVVPSDEADSLSDHLYIHFSLSFATSGGSRASPHVTSHFPRWAWDRHDRERFLMDLALRTEEPPGLASCSDLELRASRLSADMRHACDASTPRRRRHLRRKVYWWSDEIASLRRTLLRARRVVVRANRRRGRGAAAPDGRSTLSADRSVADSSSSNRAVVGESSVAADGAAYERALADVRVARAALRRAILSAKESSWRELLETLEREPWGKPYRIVMSRLRSRSSSVTEALSAEEMRRVLAGLFPVGTTGDRSARTRPRNDDPELRLHLGEVKGAFVPSKSKKPAPGPDGIPGGVWRSVSREFLGRVTKILEECIRRGVFPREWKSARLVLIPKESVSGAPRKYRPICLLNDIAKALERLIHVRLQREMRRMPGGGLEDAQYGFREGRSTVDALIVVRDFALEQRRLGRSALAVSLDVSNAFNSIPWGAINASLRARGFPDYLCNIVESYLSDREIVWTDNEGRVRRRSVTAGVPQGSVLGPLLWNLAFDAILGTRVSPYTRIICYADDTLVVTSAKTLERSTLRISEDVASVVLGMRRLGLEINAGKTTSVLLASNRDDADSRALLRVDGVQIAIEGQMKYLGVVVNTGMTFVPHFQYTADKASAMMRNLARIMPNIRGPSAIKRKLYLNVVHSVIVYAAPVWHERFAANRRVRKSLDAVQRWAAIRVAQGYRTISYAAASMLARAPPLHLITGKCARLYARRRALHDDNEFTPDAWKEAIERERLSLLRQWKSHLASEAMPTRALRSAVLPIFAEWTAAKHVAPTFHFTQLVTGHGSFGEFLRRIGKRRSARCEHCPSGQIDDASHTLSVCDAWYGQRVRLALALGVRSDADINLSFILQKCVQSRAGWSAVTDFAREVLSLKEEAERRRESRGSASLVAPSSAPSPRSSDDDSRRRRRRRGGVRVAARRRNASPGADARA